VIVTANPLNNGITGSNCAHGECMQFLYRTLCILSSVYKRLARLLRNLEQESDVDINRLPGYRDVVNECIVSPPRWQ